MAELLFIAPEEITATTILGGNVDIDKYVFCIASVQITTIEPLLGTELYNKIKNDVENTTLTGLYETLYNDFIKPITKNESLAQYIEIASYMLNNGGLFKHTGDNIEVVDKQEAQFLAQKYSLMAQMYVQRFEKWILYNPLPEYLLFSERVNATKDINLNGGWFLSNEY